MNVVLIAYARFEANKIARMHADHSRWERETLSSELWSPGTHGGCVDPVKLADYWISNGLVTNDMITDDFLVRWNSLKNKNERTRILP